MKKMLLGLNMLIGIGGLFGGFLALSTKARFTMGISQEMLKHSPFTTFLIPGLFLLLVIGVGNLLVGYSNVRKYQSYVYFEWFIGMVQLFWIMIQCIMLQGIVVLHGLFFLFGIVQILGSIWLIKKDNVPFPFSANQN